MRWDGERIEPTDRAAWRQWLSAHHGTAPRVWLVSAKKSTGRQRVGYEEAVEEALCFGWVDSTARRVDDERTELLFTPRRPGSGWAASNKARVTRLMDAGLMAEAGLRVVATAQEDGSWTLLDDVEALRPPEDLAAALAADPAADAGFAALSKSVRKQALQWVVTAKRPETRARRIAAVVDSAREGRGPL